MKHLILGCMLLVFLTACPTPDDDTDIQPDLEQVDISQVQLSSLVEIKPEQAKAMVDQINSKEGICANASADISSDELKRLLSAKGVTGIKLLRANHTINETDERLRNRPTVIVAILMGNAARYYKPLRVCPPPDGSTCLSGLDLPTTLSE